MKLEEKVYALVLVIILIYVLGLYFNWSTDLVSMLTDWGTVLLVSLVLSGIAGSIIEAFSGDTFKQIMITIPIGSGGFSISLFVILTIFLKMILF